MRAIRSTASLWRTKPVSTGRISLGSADQLAFVVQLTLVCVLHRSVVASCQNKCKSCPAEPLLLLPPPLPRARASPPVRAQRTTSERERGSVISLSALRFVRSTHSFCLVFDELMKEGAPSGLTSQTPSDQSRSFSLSQNHTHTRTPSRRFARPLTC